MHHRYYDPQLGHFLNPDFRAPDIYDPTTFTEPYAYAAGNPMMFWDADGLAKIELINRNILISDRLKVGKSVEQINKELKGFGFREIGAIEKGLHIIAGVGASVAETTVGTVNALSNATFGTISYYHYSSTGSEITRAHADKAVNTVGTLVDSVRTGTIKTSIINSGADKLERIVKAHENGNYAQLSKEVTDIGLVVVESIQGGRALARGARNLPMPQRKIQTQAPKTKPEVLKSSQPVVGKKWFTDDYPVTVERLTKEIRGYTKEGDQVANAIDDGLIKVNILDDEAFERAWKITGGSGDAPRAFANKTQVFIKKEGYHIFSDLVHEGVHVLDYISDNLFSVRHLEARAYVREMLFQQAYYGWSEYEDIFQIFKEVLNKEYPLRRLK